MPYFRDIVLGALIVGVLLLRPAGLLPQERRVSLFVERSVKRMRSEEQPPPSLTHRAIESGEAVWPPRLSRSHVQG